MRSSLAVVALLLLVTAARADVVSSVFAGRVPCTERDGVQFCEGSLERRVESWDGVPLDVNVTLPPASVPAPYPVIVELHGWSIGKTPAPLTDRALAGYAVLNYSARGFHQSCGLPAARLADPSLADPTACATRGWVRLADARYEGRDTQHLLGLLVDEGIVDGDRIGVTGASYGGGQSMILAALRDRIMLPDGTLAPWTSPAGRPLAIAAAAPLIPWSDLAEALTPAGRTLDYREANPYGTRGGIQKESWVDTLYLVGSVSGYYAPPGADPAADLTGWNARLAAGEPYDGDSAVQAILDEVTSHHSAYYIDDSVPPAPLFIYNAWTDDLFPVDEALRFWRKTRAKHPTAEIALQFLDGFGHPRSGLGGDLTRVAAAVDAFFARHLRGTGEALPGVRTWTQACNGATEAGPFVADTWDALRPGEVRFSSDVQRAFDERGGDASVAAALDPLGGPPCRTMPAVDDPGPVATWVFPAATGNGYTLMGAPTVIADLTVRGSFAQVVARLWDVAPDGMQTLVSHLLHRPRSDHAGPEVFQLHPNGWHFATGHAPKLELLGQSPGFGRRATGEFTVFVTSLELRLPVVEQPDGSTVLAPAPAVLPPSAPEPADVGMPSCGDAPRTDCAAATTARVLIKDGRKRDLLAWTWKGAPAEFGNPDATTAYRLCIWSGADTLAGTVSLRAGEFCGRRRKVENPCWHSGRRGWTYDDPNATHDGVAAASLLRSRSGKSAIGLKAQGDALTLPTLPLDAPVRVQLLGSTGACWSASFPRGSRSPRAFAARTKN